MSIWNKHAIFEKHSMVLVLGIIVAVAIGGLVEVLPLFWLRNTIERVEGMRPYTPLELAGRNIYIREGCYNCHSQQVRPLRDEVERYGHYSLAAESMYDRPFQWGSKRTGPDLARVGAKYSDDWHRQHMIRPRSVVPTSIMPGYPFLMDRALDGNDIVAHMRTNRTLGVPYSDAQIANAVADFRAQANPDDPNVQAFTERYPRSVARAFDGNARDVTEMDALIAYLQVLGTLVDFTRYGARANLR